MVKLIPHHVLTTGGEYPEFEVLIGLGTTPGVYLICRVPEKFMDAGRELLQKVIFPALYPNLKRLCEDTELIIEVIREKSEERNTRISE